MNTKKDMKKIPKNEVQKEIVKEIRKEIKISIIAVAQKNEEVTQHKRRKEHKKDAKKVTDTASKKNITSAVGALNSDADNFYLNGASDTLNNTACSKVSDSTRAVVPVVAEKPVYNISREATSLMTEKSGYEMLYEVVSTRTQQVQLALATRMRKKSGFRDDAQLNIAATSLMELIPESSPVVLEEIAEETKPTKTCNMTYATACKSVSQRIARNVHKERYDIKYPRFSVSTLMLLALSVLVFLPIATMADRVGILPGKGSNESLRRAWIIGHQADQTKDVNQAITLYKQAIKIDPNESKFWGNLGWCYEQKKEFKLSEHDYRKAIELNPNDISARINLGHVLLAEGKTSQARKVYERVIKINKNSADAWYSLGNTLFKLRLYNNAEKAYRSALAIDKNYFAARVNLGNVYCKQHRYKEAKQCFLDSKDLREAQWSDIQTKLNVLLNTTDKLSQLIKTSREG